MMEAIHKYDSTVILHINKRLHIKIEMNGQQN